ncbi:hypothetical protein [Deinococcus hopiensis]|uniref:Uncharacterized protein n=1 Tax=Deinococcus hopiensis KR-140 TaxID=695939 RepID=A0A1W1V0E1_9DEIO|nr:hypothetical protein [Deinococcus hopiensis]SMB86501.1 hypothetical protein SAMN00790413_03831 [Deinococcus hopiensis KR-140]
MPIDPRIAEILRRRAEQGVTITKTETPTLRPQSVPTPTVRPQSTASAPPPIQMPSLNPPLPIETPMDDGELAALLDGVLPRIDTLVRQAINDVHNNGRLSMAEALSLAPEVRNIVSLVIGQMLPQIKGTSARELVILVLAVLLRQYISPYLPALVRPYFTAQTLRVLVRGLEAAYVSWIKPRLQN